MKTYILTDKTWHRGQGSHDSYIKPPGAHAPRCCLGNVVQQEGWDVKVAPGRPVLPVSLEQRLLPTTRYGTKESVVWAIYKANDEKGFSDAERVERINKLTEPHGFRFEFRQDC